jgi:CHASE2 domain-containing sensor protein
VKARVERLAEDVSEMQMRKGDQAASVLVPPFDEGAEERVTVEYADVARRDPKAMSAIKDRIVIVARTDEEVRVTETVDHPSDGREVWRVYAHAASLEALIAGKTVLMPTEKWEWVAMVGSGGLGVLAGVWPRRRRMKALAVVGLTLGMIGVSLIVWWTAGVLVLIAHPLVAMVLAAVGAWWLAPRAVR